MHIERPELTKSNVGMEVFCVYRSKGRAASVATITKVGRTWAELSNNHRISTDGWVADGGGYAPPFTAYPSEAHYEHEVRLSAAWETLRSKIANCFHPPESVSAEAILEATTILGLKV
jgi:hypothetical protein